MQWPKTQVYKHFLLCPSCLTVPNVRSSEQEKRCDYCQRFEHGGRFVSWGSILSNPVIVAAVIKANPDLEFERG